ncbi:DUF7660 family protein [Tepidibacter hydrothermalis]|uniref:DUF7660 domain-containing protein n=1 Tax=Tepidibacter hydrothermalis TaxID=3036126 RepID=A0ABY8EJG1_9FIRM|nr:hypothetical protein [Tepidibacter hydrothermalis]WFD11937.1 hypothetical protein P4S50_07635 [Tepidibacter hydrothermalis]
MKERTLFELLSEVEDEDTFIDFIEALTKDRINSRYNKTNDEWQNNTIEDFLDSACSWGKCSKNGLEFYKKPNNQWKRCAQIIYMGKIYE